MVFAVFDNDALVSALQSVWSDIAPAAMFTAAANNKTAMSEDFSDALDMVKWNQTVTDAALDDSNGYNRTGYGFSFDGTNYAGNSDSSIDAQQAPGSNNSPRDTNGDGFVDEWLQDGDNIYVPAGFSPIRGENVIYADTLPPSTLQVA